MGYVYIIRNKRNGKRYVGQTVHAPQERWKQHCIHARRKNTKTVHVRTMPLIAAIKKHGEESFEIERYFEVSSQEELDRMEISLIDMLKTREKAFGYNVRGGGDGATESDRQRMSKIASARYKDERYRIKHRQANNERLNDPEFRERFKTACKAAANKPENKAILISNLQNVNEDTRRAAIKRAWADPEKRARILAGRENNH